MWIPIKLPYSVKYKFSKNGKRTLFGHGKVLEKNK